MAARRIPDPDPAPAPVPIAPDLPAPPDAAPGVIEARRVLELAEAAHARAAATLAEAEAALEQHQTVAAEQLLDDLAGGDDGEDQAGAALAAAVAAAKSRAGTCARARDLARVRLTQAQQRARREFSEAMRPTLLRGLVAAHKALSAAVAANEALRRLAAHVREHDPRAPAPHELCFPLPSPDRLQLMAAARADLVDDDDTDLEPAAGVVVIRWRQPVMPYAVGEVCGLPEAEAVHAVRSGAAELVDESRAAELGLDRLRTFSGPVRVKILKNYPTPEGNMVPAGSVLTLDSAAAERAVNLAFAEIVP